MKHFPALMFDVFLRGTLLCAICYLSQSITAFAAESGTPIFADSFDSTGTFAENWDFHGQVASRDGIVDVQAGSFSPRRVLPTEFVLEFDIALFHDMNKTSSGFAGLMIDAAHFKVKPEGKAFLVWKDIGADHSSGSYPLIDGYRSGQPVHAKVVRTIRGNLANYEYYVNNKQVGTFKAKAKDENGAEIEPKISFGVWNVDRMTIDNFRVCAVKKSTDESLNLIVNSSFETLQDGFPLYICRGGSMNYAALPLAGYEAYLKTVEVDSTYKRSGRYSLRLVNNDLTEGQTIYFHGAGTVEGQSGVFSVWLKANSDDLTVALRYGGKSKSVQVGKEWRRYEVVNPVLPKPFVYSPVQIKLPADQKGTLWIDDAQAELLESKPTDQEIADGRTFATQYRPSELDKAKLTHFRTPSEAGTFTASDSAAANDSPLTAHQPVSILGRLSFYMNEPEAQFQIQTNIPNVEELIAVLTCANQTVQRSAAASFRMAVPLANVQPGNYQAKLTLCKPDGTVVGSAETTLAKKEPSAHATQINRFSRSVIVDGKPHFQFAPFVQDFSFVQIFNPEIARSMFALYDRYGFKSAHILYTSVRPGSVETAKAYMDAAAEKDVPVMVWIGSHPCTLDEYAAGVKAIGNRNVVSYQVLDEPELWSTEEKTREYLRSHRPLFPYHPMHMNNTVIGLPVNYAGLETDILMLDDYLTNREQRTVRSVVQNADLMRRIGAAEGKPCYYFIVGGNFPLHYREPSYGEQIAQCYGCVAAGCTGLSFFYGWPQTPGNWKACVQLAKEFAVLNDALTSDEACSSASVSANPELLRVLAKKQGESVFVVSCNIDPDPMSHVEIALPSEFQYEPRAEVLFENRTVSVVNGRIEDNFDDWTRHVYRTSIISKTQEKGKSK